MTVTGHHTPPLAPPTPPPTRTNRPRVPDIPAMLRRLLASQEAGLTIVLVLLVVTLTLMTGTHVDRRTGETVNDFLNTNTVVQTATDGRFFGIMAVGATMVIISGGIDLSVGSVYALAGLSMALLLRAVGPMAPGASTAFALIACVGVGLVCGLLNGLLVVGLRVHPFIITLGTMWIRRGIAFVTTKAESILVPNTVTQVSKASLGFSGGIHPVPMLCMLAVTIVGALYLTRTVMGRHIFAFGGNIEASRFAGLALNRIQVGVFAISGLTAGFAAFLGASFYGSASSADAQGYELYVIASAVVGGASLAGGKGSADGALLGALLIVLSPQSIRTLALEQNYE